MARTLAVAALSAFAWIAAAQTATPTPYSPNPFTPGNVVVLRLGDASFTAATATAGYPLPVYLDEVVSATGALVRSVPLPISSCALAVGSTNVTNLWLYDSDGLPQLSDNGQVCTWARLGAGQCERNRSAELRECRVSLRAPSFPFLSTSSSCATRARR